MWVELPADKRTQHNCSSTARVSPHPALPAPTPSLSTSPLGQLSTMRPIALILCLVGASCSSIRQCQARPALPSGPVQTGVDETMTTTKTAPKPGTAQPSTTTQSPAFKTWAHSARERKTFNMVLVSPQSLFAALFAAAKGMPIAVGSGGTVLECLGGHITFPPPRLTPSSICTFRLVSPNTTTFVLSAPGKETIFREVEVVSGNVRMCSSLLVLVFIFHKTNPC